MRTIYNEVSQGCEVRFTEQETLHLGKIGLNAFIVGDYDQFEAQKNSRHSLENDEQVSSTDVDFMIRADHFAALADNGWSDTLRAKREAIYEAAQDNKFYPSIQCLLTKNNRLLKDIQVFGPTDLIMSLEATRQRIIELNSDEEFAEERVEKLNQYLHEDTYDYWLTFYPTLNSFSHLEGNPRPVVKIAGFALSKSAVLEGGEMYSPASIVTTRKEEVLLPPAISNKAYVYVSNRIER